MLKPKESADTWSGAGRPDIIGQWGKMRLCVTRLAGPGGTRFPS
jgi:hypothetical protein